MIKKSSPIPTEPPSIKLFMEAISSDWWGRHRTEGYCYLRLPLEPGCFTKTLSCSRPEEANTVDAESRRFFLGGCHLIKDLEVLAEPQLQVKWIASYFNLVIVSDQYQNHNERSYVLIPVVPWSL